MSVLWTHDITKEREREWKSGKDYEKRGRRIYIPRAKRFKREVVFSKRDRFFIFLEILHEMYLQDTEGTARKSYRKVFRINWDTENSWKDWPLNSYKSPWENEYFKQVPDQHLLHSWGEGTHFIQRSLQFFLSFYTAFNSYNYACRNFERCY